MTPIRMLRTALAAASAMMLLAGTAQAADGMDVASAKTIYSQGAKADLSGRLSHEEEGGRLFDVPSERQGN